MGKIRKTWLAPMALYLGGVPAMSIVFVALMRMALCHTNTWKKHSFLSSDVHKMLLDDPDLFEVFRKEMDKRRKPPVAAFVNAKLSGVTFAGMDKLRFATIWTPGHSTLAKAIRQQESAIEQHWCPSGPKPSRGTTRTAAEQAATAEQAAAAAGDAREEDTVTDDART